MRKIIRAERLNGPLEYDCDVLFPGDVEIVTGLTAKAVTAKGRLVVRGTLRCDSLEHSVDIPPACGRLIVAGEDLGGDLDVDSPVTIDPDDLATEDPDPVLVGLGDGDNAGGEAS